MAAARFGLDVGRGSVKLVRVDKRGAVGAERELDPALDGPARRVALLDAVRTLLRELGARASDEVQVAVPRAEAIVKVVVVPPLKDEELERAVRLQALRDLPFDIADVVLAWGRLGAAPAGDPARAGAEEVIVAAVRRAGLDDVRALVAEAGAVPGAVEVSTQAAARCLARLGPQGPGEVVLVEVGRATTDIIVLERTAPAGAAPDRPAGAPTTARLVWSRSASVGCGARAPEVAGGEAPAWLERLGHEVSRSLVAARSARGSTRTGPPDALLVAGGGAAVAALGGVLEARVGVRPAVLDGLATEAGPGPAPAHDPHRGARFVVARGLADATPVPGVPLLDLADRARDQRAAATRRRALVSGAVAAVVTAGAVVLAERTIDARAAVVRRLEDERRTLAPLVARARAIEAELAAARTWEERRGRELEVLLALVKAIPSDQAYLTSVRWTDGRGVTLSGRARDWEEVGRFVSALEQDPLVRRARPTDIKNLEGSRQDEGVDFSAVVELREGAAGGTP